MGGRGSQPVDAVSSLNLSLSFGVLLVVLIGHFLLLPVWLDSTLSSAATFTA